MKNLNLIFLITITAFTFASCATVKKTTEVMDSWKGTHISRVISSWGPETRITGDGKGGKIYTWDTRWKTNAYYDYSGVYQPPRERYCTKNFYVSEKGIIYSWRWQGSCG